MNWGFFFKGIINHGQSRRHANSACDRNETRAHGYNMMDEWDLVDDIGWDVSAADTVKHTVRQKALMAIVYCAEHSVSGVFRRMNRMSRDGTGCRGVKSGEGWQGWQGWQVVGCEVQCEALVFIYSVVPSIVSLFLPSLNISSILIYRPHW